MKEYKFYLTHAAIQYFTEISFISFGSLLIYLKTGSILNTLIFGAIMKLTAMVVKSFFVKPYLSFVKNTGVIKVMIGCLFLWGASLVGLFLIHADNNSSVTILYLIGVVYSLAHSGYWMLSNTFGFSYVGLSKTPGRYSSYWQIATIFPGIIAALAGLFLNIGNNFLGLLLLMGILLIVSIIPLGFLKAPEVRVVSFKDCVRKISTNGFWANVNPEYTMINVAVPLIILFSFGSLSKSIWVSVIVTIVTVIFVYFIGKSKDHKDNRLVGLSSVALIGGLIYYGLADSPMGFVVAGVVVGISMSMVDTSREACAGRELTNNHDPMAGTVAIEFARSFGGFLGELILIFTYLITGSLWQPILIFGAITILPKVFYAIKNIQVTRLSSAD